MRRLVFACWAVTALMGIPIAVFAHQYTPIIGLSIGSLFYTSIWFGQYLDGKHPQITPTCGNSPENRP